MKYIKSFEDFTPINEAEATEVNLLIESISGEYEQFSDLYENLTVTDAGLKTVKGAELFFLLINGKKYGYAESPIAKISAKDLAEKFGKIAKYSAGKALAWVKKNSALASRPQDEIKEENA